MNPKNMGGGTEAFPDLGKHCQHKGCNQLDFLPFTCNRCEQVFCLEHRTYRSHKCQKPDQNSRKVVVCELCSMSIETTGLDTSGEEAMLERHGKSGECDPSKKKKPTCPVKRCKEVLTFSNTATCKTCRIKVCLKHRFPADHTCMKASPAASMAVAGGSWKDKFLVALAARNVKDCARSSSPRSVSKSGSPSVKACWRQWYGLGQALSKLWLIRRLGSWNSVFDVWILHIQLCFLDFL